MNNWLDKYEDGGYLGTTNVGRNYSPAWGGQFDMGGDIPGSVGFTYARTGDIPDNGKYAKKTLASAQNGKEMQFYQEGLDFQPKTISQKGSKIPPDNRARGDMQSSYPQIARMYDGPQRKALAEAIGKREDEQRARRIIESQPSVSQYTPNKELEAANRYKFAKQYAATHGGYADDEGNIEETFVDRIMDSKTAAKAWDNIVVPGFEAEMLVSGAGLVGQGLKAAGKYAVENTALKNAYKLNPLAEKLINANKSYRVTGLDAFEDFKNTGVLRSAQQGVPEGASFAEKAMSRPTGFPSFQKGYADMRYLPEEGGVVFETGLPTYKRGEINPVTGNQIRGRHYAHRAIDPTTGATLAEIPASDIRVFGGKPNWLKGYPEISKQKQGGIIKDDRGQLAHPGEITQIDSNDITMRGVNYPVLGIGADGEQMMMQPGEDYKFNKGPVTEFPMAKGGMSVNNADAQPLEKLDQLTNFTNYNKPTKGGWLSKYE